MTHIENNWYEIALQYDVEKDIRKNKRIYQKCKPYFKKFVRFAAIQRVNYENNIELEWQEFEQKYLKKRLYNTDVRLWKKISKEVFKRDHYTCFYCGSVGGLLEVDHKIPISRGGSNEISNLVTSCRHCNRQKRNKTPSEYLKWRETHE